MRIKKLTTAFDRYDTLIHRHITEDISERNDPELEAAATALNKAIGEAEETEKKLTEKMIVDMYAAAVNVNRYADEGDANRNRVNYGILETCASVLRLLGNEATSGVWQDDNGFLRIPRVTINGKTTELHNGK